MTEAGSAKVITETGGDLLDAEVDALVNTVNTVGVMGKGLALQFRRAYPAMFAEYAKEARAGQVRLGRMHVWDNRAGEMPRYIVNFPTKGHWRDRSRLADIETGLEDLAAVVTRLGVASIAVPPLGCGLGGLAWAQVRPLIERTFAGMPDVDVRLYVPEGARRPT